MTELEQLQVISDKMQQILGAMQTMSTDLHDYAVFFAVLGLVVVFVQVIRLVKEL